MLESESDAEFDTEFETELTRSETLYTKSESFLNEKSVRDSIRLIVTISE